MILYASRTGTRRNLEAMREYGFRLLVSATGEWRHEGFPYALDNGAWTYHQRGQPFDDDRFRRMLDQLGDGADWVVIPDVVGDARQTLDAAERWIPELCGGPPQLLALQDGMTEQDVAPLADRVDGLFLGGTTEWKLATMDAWGRFARESGLYYHVARVNSARRIHHAKGAGAHSVDGTSATRWATTIPGLARANAQATLPFGHR